MITLEHVYWLSGLFFAALAFLSVRDHANSQRLWNALFWSLISLSFLIGSHLSDFANGVLALAIIAIGGAGRLGRSSPPTTDSDTRRQFAALRGHRLLAPALIIPAIALLGGVVLKDLTVFGHVLFQPRQAAVISLALGAVIGTTLALVWFRAPLSAPLQEGRRIMDTVGWAALLPQMLASLGALFAVSGVGEVVGEYTSLVIPEGNRLAAVAVFCLGMALFTILMGNAFAAFPVMAAAIGLPVIVIQYGGDPAAMGAVGMLAGFCGTLMTPMAANFNLVPAALLQLPDRNGVIKAQFPTALIMLGVNIVILYVLAFRG